MKILIDNKEVEATPDMNIIQAAKTVGIDIPAMCYREGLDHFTSCMICVVKDKATGRVLPACSAKVAEGMEIETENKEIYESRKSTLELLLSEHVGDCEAPCQRVCPVSMNIPKMIREIMGEENKEAIETVRKEMAVPSILERYCNAPCENGCRRGKYDEGISIRHLARYSSDLDIQSGTPFIPPCAPPTGKKIAIVGAGMTGLSALNYLLIDGNDCTLFEQDTRPGGRLHTEFSDVKLEDWVIQGELDILTKMGAQLNWGVTLGKDITLPQLKEEYDAVVLAIGEKSLEDLEALGLAVTKKGLKINPKTYMTGIKGVFAGGSVVKGGQPIIKSATMGKEMAACAHQHASGLPITGVYEMFNFSMGRLMDGEVETFVEYSNPIPRVAPDGLEERGYLKKEAEEESSRCLHCDCREVDNCKLRIYSDRYGVNQRKFKGEERDQFVHVNQDAGAVYEPGKCIKCGLCVRVTKDEGEQFGFTFVGRGFDLKTAVPLSKTLKDGLKEVADLVIEACPTGALADNEKLRRMPKSMEV